MLNTFCPHTFEMDIFHMCSTKIFHQKENYKLKFLIVQEFKHCSVILRLFREFTFQNVVLPCYYKDLS